jgi:hypothetical protein
MRCPRFCARPPPWAVRVRIRSRSRSARPPNTAIINRPVLVPVSADGSAKDRNCALASTDALDDAEQVEGAAREPAVPRHRHHVAVGQLAEHPIQLAPVGARGGRLFAVEVPAVASGGAKLLKLDVGKSARRC